MNKKRIVATLTGAVLIATLVVPFAACKKGGKDLGETTAIKIEDYAKEITESNLNLQKSRTAYTKATKLFDYSDRSGADTSLVNSTELGALTALKHHLEDGSYTYSVYNLNLAKEIKKDLDYFPEVETENISTYNFNAQFSYVKLTYQTTTEGVTNTEHEYLLPDGTTLFPKAEYTGDIQFSDAVARYVGDDEETSYVFSVTSPSVAGEDPVVKYFKVVKDEVTGVISFASVKESDIKVVSPDYAAGIDEPLYMNLYDGLDVTGEIKDYKVGFIGNTYTFYKGEQETGSVNLENGGVVGATGNYLYYFTKTVVASDAKTGYNLVYTDGNDIQIKFDYTLFKYDIINNKVTELNYNVYVENITPLYNHTAKACDAAIVTGYKMIDGVAYTGDDADVEASPFTYITDADLNVANDVTDLAIESGNFHSIYKIEEGKYLIGSNVVDKNLKLLNRGFRGDKVFIDEKLIMFSAGSCYGFRDFSGKVVIEPKYMGISGSIEFYNGIAYVNEIQPDGTPKRVLLHSNGTVTTPPKGSQVYDGVYLVTKTSGMDTTYEVFNFAGTSLKKSTAQLTVKEFDGGLFVTEHISASQTYNVYKLA